MSGYDNSAFDEFKRIFTETATEYNALNPEISENINEDELTNMFFNIRDKLNILANDYDNSLCFREREILDTFIQLLNYILDHCSVCKYYSIYKKLSALCSDLFSNDSELTKLLKLLKQYVIKYNEMIIPSDTECVVDGNTTTYGLAIENYALLKSNLITEKARIDENCNEIDDWINGYNEYVETYYNLFYNLLEKSTDNTAVVSENGVLYYNITPLEVTGMLLENIPDNIEGIESAMVKNSKKIFDNKIYYGTVAELNTIYDTFGYDICSGLQNLNSFINKDCYWEEIEVGSYGDTGIIATDSSTIYDMEQVTINGNSFNIPRNTTIINVSKTEENGNVTEILLDGYGGKNGDNKLPVDNLMLYKHNQPFIVGDNKKLLPYTYDWKRVEGVGNNVVNYEKTQLTIYYDVENDEYYRKNTNIQNIDNLIVPETDGDEEVEASVLPLYETLEDNTPVILYPFNGNVYKYTNGIFDGILNLENNPIPTFTESTPASLIGLYKETLSQANLYKDAIKTIEESYAPKQLLISKIKEIAKKIYEYIVAYAGIGQDAALSISIPDENGNVDVVVGENDNEQIETFKSRSISAKSFKDNRFIGMVGKVDRTGLVAQKSYVFITIPVTKNNKRKNKKIRVSSPNLKIQNIEFKHDPKCVVFKLFNRWDYTAKITIENDGEKPNNKNKSPYVTGKYYIRFGSVFPAKKDIDLNVESQQIRISEPNKTSSWSSGRIKKKGIYSASNLNIKGIFKNDEARYSTNDREEYINKFADKIDLSYEINSTINNKTYIFSGEGLSYDSSIKNEMVERNWSEYWNCSFFKGTAKLKDPDNNDNQTATDTTSSKDIIVMIKPQGNTYSDKGYYSVSIYLDPDSTMNNQIYEQNEDDESIYLPMLASSLYVSKCYCKSVLSKTTTSDKMVGALLGLSTMFNDENFAPINNDLFNTFSNDIDMLKVNILKEIIDAINNIGSSAQTVVLTNSLYKSYDSSYSDKYVSDIITEYSYIKSKSDTFVSQINDVEALFKGTYKSDIENYICKLNGLYTDYITDIINSEEIIHKYKNRLNVIMPSAMQQVSLASTLSLFYNFATGSSQTLNAMSLGGGKIITTYLSRVYTEWLNIYNEKVYNSDDVTKTKFIIEQEYLQLFYILSVINDSLRNEYNPISHELDEYLRSLLLRFLSENIYNTHLSELFASDVIQKIKKYKEYGKLYDIDNMSFNTYYINPYITEIFPQLEAINTIDVDHLPNITVANIENLNIDDIQKFDMTNFFKPLIYKSILEDTPITIKDKLTKLWNFLNNGQHLNVRELILKYNLMIVLYELETEIENSNYHIGLVSSGSVIDNIKDILKAIVSVSEYRELINDYTIDRILNNDSDTENPCNTTLVNLLKNRLATSND